MRSARRRGRAWLACAWLAAAVGCARASAATDGVRAAPPLPGKARYADGHARPRALAVDARGDLLYVALSTANRVSVLDVSRARPRVAAELGACDFPDALAALPGGGVVVSCRYDPSLRIITRPAAADAAAAGTAVGPSASASASASVLGQPAFAIRAIDAGPEHGHQGLAIDDVGHFAYVASPALGGVKVVDLRDPIARSRFLATGRFPKRVRFVPARAGGAAGRATPLLLVANFLGHTVTIHDVGADGSLSPARQTIVTEAPVMDMAVLPAGVLANVRAGALALLTHEDRPLSREHISVEGLDSVVLVLPPSAPGDAVPFADPGRGKRAAVNLTERTPGALVELESMAIDPESGRLAVVGAGTDNLLVTQAPPSALGGAPAVAVGANPTAVAFLGDRRVVTADRLSDTVSFVSLPSDPAREAGHDVPAPATGPKGSSAAGQRRADAGASGVLALPVGRPERRGLAERGEVLFYSRALVPHNVADGPLSVYTCAACHADGGIDGRRHPSRRNRFFSMTKTCRGLAGTEPFLSLGTPDTLAAFADDIVATHAQGALDSPRTYDRYPVTLRLFRRSGAPADVTLSPGGVRAALAAYMAVIPPEPSPFVAPGRRALTAAEARGLELFRAHCSGCHELVPSTSSPRRLPARNIEASLLAGQLALTSPRLYDVGTPVLGDGGNNPPSLRGVWAAGPYFSDGSAATLDDVLHRTDPSAPKVHAAENASRPPAWSAGQRDDLLAFLRAL